MESVKQGWVPGPDGRGTFDILWSCLVTMFLGSWSALFLNLPEPESGKRQFLKTKGSWTLFVLLFPEMITGLAAEQWRSARQSMEDFSSLRRKWESAVLKLPSTLSQDDTLRLKQNLLDIKSSPWTMRHAFFADMGGISLHCPDFPPFAITAYQLHHLVANDYIAYPHITQREIWDKNKADALARVLTVLQFCWFLIQAIGRAAQKLAVTTLELSTLAFILCTINTFFFWFQKPLDVEEPISLTCDRPLADILFQEGQDLSAGFFISPLEYINPPISSNSLVAPFWIGFDVCFKEPPSKVFEVADHFPNTRTVPPRGLIKRDLLYAAIFVFAYFGIHLVAWDFHFPSSAEQWLWRITTFVLIVLSGLYFAAVVLSNYAAQSFSKSFLGGESFRTPVELAYKLPRWAAWLVHLPFIVLYVLARMYIIVEGFASLRSLSESAYSTVKWQNFIPHFS